MVPSQNLLPDSVTARMFRHLALAVLDKPRGFLDVLCRPPRLALAAPDVTKRGSGEWQRAFSAGFGYAAYSIVAAPSRSTAIQLQSQDALPPRTAVP